MCSMAMVSQYGSFLEVAFVINLLLPWRTVYDYLSCTVTPQLATLTVAETVSDPSLYMTDPFPWH